jgi:CBS domain containing-hemolysin-like protein
MKGMTPLLAALFYILAFFFSMIRESCKSLSESKIKELAAGKGKRINLEYYLRHTERTAFAAESIKILFTIAFVSSLWVFYFLHFREVGGLPFLLWTIGVLVVGCVLIAFLNFLTYLLAKYKGENVLLALLPFAHLFGILLAPIAALGTSLNELAAKAFLKSESEPENGTIAEDIMQVVDTGERAGVIHEEEAEMIEGAVSFKNLKVTEVMTPRIDMVCVKASANLQDVRPVAIDKGHSRLPVFDKNRDDIVGILYVKDMLRFSPEEFPGKTVREVMRKAYYIPEMKRIGELLKEFKTNRVHIAIVLDEYGGTAGLVTIEDMVEEIFGEIEDEYDYAREVPMKKISPTALEVSGNAHISEINEELGVHIPEDEDYETITGFIFKYLGRVPKVGEKLKYRTLTLTVKEATERKIKKIQIELPRQEIAS